MTPRVARLREQSLTTAPWLSHERALLLTEFYEHAPAASVPMTRALAFEHLMEKKAIYIGAEDLIVGERGPSPKGTPTYPELCCHTLEDLDVLHSREKISYRVCDEARAAYRDRIIPFWRGRSMRDLLFAQMTPEWKAAYDAGVFTEFMEQRAPASAIACRLLRRGPSTKRCRRIGSCTSA
jgi:pyruvate-formate lyase